MAREVLTFAGAAIGFYVGGPYGAAVGAQLGGMVGSYVDPQEIEGPRLKDFKVTGSQYGEPIPLIYGLENRVAGNVIWSTGLKERKEERRQGKGGGPVITEYKYSLSCAVAIGQGPVQGLRKIWANNKVIFDIDALSMDMETTTAGVMVVGGYTAAKNQFHNASGSLFDAIGTLVEALQSGGPFARLLFYPGLPEQDPDPTIESHLGVGNTPAYRHTSYVVLTDLQLEDFGNRMPNFEFEVAGGDLLLEHVEEFTETGADTWTPPANIYRNRCDVIVVGGGGSGNTSHDGIVGYFIAGGGGGGGVDIREGVVVEPGTEVDVVVGAGGGKGAFGGRGEGSSFGNISVSGGGQGGSGNNSGASTANMDGASGGGGGLHADDATSAQQPSEPVIVQTPGSGIGGQGYAGSAGAVGGVSTSADQYRNMLGGGGGGAFAPGGIAGGGLDVRFGGPGIFDIPDWAKALGYAGFGGGGAGYGYTAPPPTPNPAPGGLGGGGNAGVGALSTGGTIGAQSPDAQSGTPNTGGGGGAGLASQFSVDEGAGGSGVVLVHYYTLVEFGFPVTVGQVVRDICRRAGVDNVSVSGLDMPLRGYVVGFAGPAFAALKPLARAYNFDVAEQGGQIRCILRGRGMRGVVPLEHMGAVAGGDAERIEPIRYDTASDLGMPQEVSVSYSDPAMDYQINTQRRRRDEGYSENNINIELPLVLEADKAIQVTDRVLWEAWAGRNTARFKVSDLWLRRDPADVLGIPVAGGIVPHRLLRVTRGNDGVIEMEVVRDDPEVYDSDATSIPGNIPANEIQLPGPTRLVLMDMPILHAAHDNTGFYWVASGENRGWRGAQILRSSDGGLTYNVMSPIGVRAVIGDIASPLPTGPSEIWDRGNTITVELYYEDDELESVSELNVLNGANAAWVGPASGEGGELIQFATATLVAANTYELTDLLRGRLGTEHAIGQHGADEVFVLLEQNSLGRTDYGAADLSHDRLYKPVSVMSTEVDTSSQEFTNDGVGKKPLSPVHVDGERDGGNDLTITWLRRTRHSVPGLGRGPVPLGEETEAYEIDILAGNPQAVVRTLTATSPAVVYTAAQQTADGLTPGDPVDVAVYQMSAVVGRGFGATVTV